MKRAGQKTSILCVPFNSRKKWGQGADMSRQPLHHLSACVCVWASHTWDDLIPATSGSARWHIVLVVAHIPPRRTSVLCSQAEATKGMTKPAHFSDKQKSLLGERFRSLPNRLLSLCINTSEVSQSWRLTAEHGCLDRIFMSDIDAVQAKIQFNHFFKLPICDIQRLWFTL